MVTVLLACDTNPRYLCFWNYVHKFWVDYINVSCKMILIANEIPEYLNHKEDIILFKPVNNLPTPFQAQCIRLLYPCLMSGIISINDMDVLPLQKGLFDKTLKELCDDKEKFIIFSSGVSVTKTGQKNVTMGFSSAYQETWHKIFGINNMEDIRVRLIEWYDGIKNQDKLNVWHCDQINYYQNLNKYGFDKIIFTGQWHDNNRILRYRKHKEKENHFENLIKNVKNGDYTLYNEIKNGKYLSLDLPAGYFGSWTNEQQLNILKKLNIFLFSKLFKI